MCQSKCLFENPQSGLLKTSEVVQGLVFKDVEYRMYGAPYRKRTRLWTNMKGTPRFLCTHTSHPMTAQKGPSRRVGQLIRGDDYSFQTLPLLFVALTREIIIHFDDDCIAKHFFEADYLPRHVQDAPINCQTNLCRFQGYRQNGINSNN